MKTWILPALTGLLLSAPAAAQQLVADPLVTEPLLTTTQGRNGVGQPWTDVLVAVPATRPSSGFDLVNYDFHLSELDGIEGADFAVTGFSPSWNLALTESNLTGGGFFSKRIGLEFTSPSLEQELFFRITYVPDAFPPSGGDSDPDPAGLRFDDRFEGVSFSTSPHGPNLSELVPQATLVREDSLEYRGQITTNRVPHLATDQGLTAAVYRSNNRIFVKCSEDLGESWSTPEELSTGDFNSFFQQGRNVFVHGDRIYVFWVAQDTDTGPEQVVMRRSSDRGETWEAPLLFPYEGSGSGVQSSRYLVATVPDSGGNRDLDQLYVLQQEIQGASNRRMRLSASVDGGATVTSTVVAPTFPSSQFGPGTLVAPEPDHVMFVHLGDELEGDPGTSAILVESVDGGASITVDLAYDGNSDIIGYADSTRIDAVPGGIAIASHVRHGNTSTPGIGYKVVCSVYTDGNPKWNRTVGESVGGGEGYVTGVDWVLSPRVNISVNNPTNPGTPKVMVVWGDNSETSPSAVGHAFRATSTDGGFSYGNRMEVGSVNTNSSGLRYELLTTEPLFLTTSVGTRYSHDGGSSFEGVITNYETNKFDAFDPGLGLYCRVDGEGGSATRHDLMCHFLATPQVESRTDGANLDVLRTSSMVQGDWMSCDVDLQASGYSRALVLMSSQTANVPMGQYRWLVDPNQAITLGVVNASSPRLRRKLWRGFAAGETFSFQALLRHPMLGTALTNAQDTMIGH